MPKMPRWPKTHERIYIYICIFWCRYFKRSFSSHNALKKRCEIIKMNGDTPQQQFTFEWAACVCGNQRASCAPHTSHYDARTLTGNKGANGLLAACFPMRNTGWRVSQKAAPTTRGSAEFTTPTRKISSVQIQNTTVRITRGTRRRSLLKFECTGRTKRNIQSMNSAFPPKLWS